MEIGDKYENKDCIITILDINIISKDRTDYKYRIKYFIGMDYIRTSHLIGKTLKSFKKV